MKQENIFYKIITKIKRIFNKQKTIGESVVENNSGNHDVLEEKMSLLELEELQYELENEYITEDELNETQKEQLKEMYKKQINELKQNINYIKYEVKKQ